MQEKKETWVRSLGPEDPLEEGQPTPLFLPGESHGQRSLVDCRPQGCKVSDMSDYTSTIITYRYKTKYEKHFFFLKMGTQDSLSCSVVQSLSCLTLCNPTEYGLLVVLRHHMELAQTNVHGVNDAIQPSHPLSWANYQSFSFSISSSNEYS